MAVISTLADAQANLMNGERHTGEYVLDGFSQIFVDDRLVRREAIHVHTNAQSTTVFSQAMTVMDKVKDGKKKMERRGSYFAARSWVCTEGELCDGQGPTPENLRRKLSTVMESVSWVCEDALRDHQWVTELNVTLKENEILVALDEIQTLTCLAHSSGVCCGSRHVRD